MSNIALKDEVFTPIFPEFKGAYPKDGYEAFWVKNVDNFDIMALDAQANNLNKITIDEKSKTVREAIISALKEVKINELAKQNDILVKPKDEPEQMTFSMPYGAPYEHAK